MPMGRIIGPFCCSDSQEQYYFLLYQDKLHSYITSERLC